ncbi:MAG: RDD family protein [Bdellovibrionales bacterium]|nr:RDD family protein [Bdellovibrionales bacterium]
MRTIAYDMEENDEQEHIPSGNKPALADRLWSAPFTDWLPAGLVWRAIAFFIDSMIVTFLSTVATAIVLSIIVSHYLKTEIPNLLNLIHVGDGQKLLEQYGYLGIPLVVIPAITPVLYGIVFEMSALAGTPGKLTMGLRVSNGFGERAPGRDITLRNIFKFLYMIVTPVGGVLTIILFQVSPSLGAIVTFGWLVATLLSLLFLLVDTLSPLMSYERAALHDSWSTTLVVQAYGTNRFLRTFIGIILCLGISAVEKTLISKILGESFGTVIEPLLNRENQNHATSKDSFVFSTPIPTPTEPKITPSPTPKAIPTQIATTTPPPSPKPSATKPLVVEKLPTLRESQPTPTPVRESISGRVKIQGQSYNIKSAVAVLSKSRRSIALNLYDAPISGMRKMALQSDFQSALTDSQALIRFQLHFNDQNASSCAASLKNYIMEVNAHKAGIRARKPFVSFKRGGNQIVSQEFVDFQCRRVSDGWIGADIRGVTAFLLEGTRLAIRWDIRATAKFQ